MKVMSQTPNYFHETYGVDPLDATNPVTSTVKALCAAGYRIRHPRNMTPVEFCKQALYGPAGRERMEIFFPNKKVGKIDQYEFMLVWLINHVVGDVVGFKKDWTISEILYTLLLGGSANMVVHLGQGDTKVHTIKGFETSQEDIREVRCPLDIDLYANVHLISDQISNYAGKRKYVATNLGVINLLTKNVGDSSKKWAYVFTPANKGPKNEYS